MNTVFIYSDGGIEDSFIPDGDPCLDGVTFERKAYEIDGIIFDSKQEADKFSNNFC